MTTWCAVTPANTCDHPRGCGCPPIRLAHTDEAMAEPGHTHTCGGCQPRPREIESYVCHGCYLRAVAHLSELGLPTAYRTTTTAPGQRQRHGQARQLPSLYDRLLLPVPRNGYRRQERPFDDVAVSMFSDPMASRDAITRMLTVWSDDLSLPDVPSMTRALIAKLPAIFASTPDDADQLSHDIDHTWTDATRAYDPDIPAGQPLGECPDCGTTIRATDLVGTIRCRGCGAERDIDDWRRLIVGTLEHERSATAADLVAYLTDRHRRQFTQSAIRQWASRGVKGIDLARLGTDERGRALYSVADATRIAQALYGPARAST